MTQIKPLWIGLLALCTYSCGSSSKVGPAHQVLRQYYDKLEEKFLPEGGVGFPNKRVDEVARRHLVSHVDLLHEHAAWNLKRLPRGTLPELTDWESMIPDKEMATIISPTFSTPANSTVSAILAAWNPVWLAGRVLNLVQVRFLGAARFGKRSMLRAIAPPEMVCVDSTPQSPSIAFVSAFEVFEVRMKYQKEGYYYIPTRINWYKKKRTPASSSPASLPAKK
ncbi:MAG: hypothetical protein JRH20_20785 [Deltaproteobacteria bacterium]|nr:hypothetical protein [Deltaproteobacteria bacterium]